MLLFYDCYFAHGMLNVQGVLATLSTSSMESPSLVLSVNPIRSHLCIEIGMKATSHISGFYIFVLLFLQYSMVDLSYWFPNIVQPTSPLPWITVA